MSLSSTNVNKLNKMNRAAQDASLGTRIALAPISGSYVALTADASGSAITIATGQTDLTGHMVQASRSGSQLSIVNVVNSGSNLSITSGGTWKIAAGDVINYIVY